jgi:hypothetical protein
MLPLTICAGRSRLPVEPTTTAPDRRRNLAQGRRPFLASQLRRYWPLFKSGLVPFGGKGASTKESHPGRTVPRAEACAFVRAQSEIAPLIANGRARSRHSADVRAKRRMIALNLGSCTFSAASLAETHFTSRWRRSGHCLFWRLTFSGKTCTSQSTTRPFLKRFSYANDPRGCLRTAPTTPASSNASRAAE